MTDREFQEFVVNQLITLTEGQQAIINRVDHLENKIDRLELRLENEAFDKIKALLDGYQQHTEIMADHTNRLERIETKLETHDIQIHVLDKTKSNKRKVK